MGGKTSTGMLDRSWLHGGGESPMGPGITEAQLLKAVQGREKHPGIFPPPVCQSSITAFHWLNLPDGSWESYFPAVLSRAESGQEWIWEQTGEGLADSTRASGLSRSASLETDSVFSVCKNSLNCPLTRFAHSPICIAQGKCVKKSRTIIFKYYRIKCWIANP